MNKPRQLITKPLKIYAADPYVIYDTRLPDSFCDELRTYYSGIDPSRGQVWSNNEPDYRKVYTRWSRPNDWVNSFMWNYIQTVNHTHFRYDLSGMYFTECHHLEYHPGQYYHWHEDTVASQVLAFDDPTFPSAVSLPDEYTRKLSFILQLSNPEDYTGGVVQILNDSQRKMITVPRERGTLCIFDSRIRHRVKQVKTGVRYVLVGWAVGPRWK